MVRETVLGPARLRLAPRTLLLYVALGLLALALPWLLEILPNVAAGYYTYLISLGIIYAIVAVGLNLLIGYSGQFSLGHAGFMAIGAYTTAILVSRFEWPFLLAMLASALLTALVGFLLGLPALRLSGPYLAVMTLGFGLAVPQLIVWRGDLTGGSSGLHGLAPMTIPLWFGGADSAARIVFNTGYSVYYLALLMLVGLTWLAANLVNSHTGRAFVSIRDSELAAQAMGVNLVRYKTTAFAISALYAGIAGSLYVTLIRGISPEDFTLFLSVQFLAMIVLGGLGSIQGALLGAFVLTAVQFSLTRLPIVNTFQNLYIVVFGLVLILTIMFLPNGIAGALRNRRT